MKNKLFSLITLCSLMMMNFQFYHHHELDSNNISTSNQEDIYVVSDKDSHSCDFCELSFTKYVSNVEKFVNHDSHSDYSFLQNLNFVSYKSVHGIPNKSPPVA